MDTMLKNSGNSKTSDPYRFVLNLAGELIQRGLRIYCVVRS